MRTMKSMMTAMAFVAVTLTPVAHADQCDNAISGIESDFVEQGGAIKTYFYCLKADKTLNCNEEAVAAYREGWSKDAIIALIELMGDYHLCKMLNN